jgi:hypothetical protein
MNTKKELRHLKTAETIKIIFIQEKEKTEMKKIFIVLFTMFTVFCIVGCNTAATKAVQSAGNKNLNLDGYLMYGDLETANPETATPQGKLIIGRMSYKSRKVGIPADQKVPTTGYFKATKTKSLFGTEEMIIEYDFTAGSDKDAETALKELEKRKKEAEKATENKEK